MSETPKTESSGEQTVELSGLTAAEADRRLAEAGPNEIVTSRRIGPIVEIILLFANPLVIILLLASAISFAVGEWINASIIVLMVFLSVILNFVQTSRSRNAAARLRQEVSLTATVLRDGKWGEILRREVVPGDVISLSAGDLVPADSRIVECSSFHVQESALTGESLPVEKSSDKDMNRIFLGTSVISGTAIAIVTETGKSTELGHIAARLVERSPETEFERGTKKFGYFIARVIFVLVIFVFFVNALMERDLLESLLFSIALAVGLTPEFLPMITTVTLGQGAMRMAKKKVIVKHLEAIQNFGSIDILCSDKTGTLTRGEMALKDHCGPFGKPSEFPFFLAYLNSRFETGVSNPLDTAIRSKEVSNPLDAAILSHDQPKISDYCKAGEIPFDFERRRVSVIAESKHHRLLITKGAPESVLDICTRYREKGKIGPLDDQKRSECEQTFKAFSENGLRVLAVAYRETSTKGSYQQDDETELIFAGYITFADEPLETATEAIEDLKNDGVTVKILTGDNELVARYVCEQVGLDVENIVLGDEIDALDDAALGQVAESTTVFARVSPIQKNRILLALKARGHVVGFLGDGINDAPSLHSADVGISVATATDVAKDAAEIVLMERSLAVLHNGIIEGRKSFGNVMKYLLMGTSSNFGNMFSMAGAVMFLPFLPMLPTQILLNNFLYDLAQVTIPTDTVDETFIHKPHRWDVGLIRDFMLYIGPISSIYDFATFYILLAVFHASEKLFHTGWFVESLATQILVIFIIRTAGNPLRSRPSPALVVAITLVLSAGVILPFTPIGEVLGFVPLPAGYFIFLVGATITYLFLVELVKRKLMRRLIETPAG